MSDASSSTARPTWSIITVTYNSVDDLRRHWGAVELPTDTEWIVVDNDSRDDSIAVARSLGARTIQSEHGNVGFGAANNIGAASARGEKIIFANPDVTIDFGSLSDLARVIDRYPGVVLAPQLVNADGSLQASGRGFPTIWAKIWHRLAPKFSSSYTIVESASSERWISWAMGAAILMSRDTFEMLKWDEAFFVYYEDADIGLRAWQQAGGVLLTGRARWLHGWARDTARFNSRAWRLEFDSMFIFYRRYLHLLLPGWLARAWHPERGMIGRVAENAVSNGHE